MSASAHSYHLHAIHGERSIVCCLCPRFCLSPCFSLSPTSSLPTSTCTPPSMWTAPRETLAAPSPNEEYCTLAIYTPPTGLRWNVSQQVAKRCKQGSLNGACEPLLLKGKFGWRIKNKRGKCRKTEATQFLGGKLSGQCRREDQVCCPTLLGSDVGDEERKSSKISLRMRTSRRERK